MAPEVAPEHLWRKSSYSDQQGGSCVEMVELTSQVGIRDSKAKNGPALVLPAAAWTTFVDLVRSGASASGATTD
ncbi:DUF397 domain-containing protein [Streptomyces sp. NPDC002018]|uniref:DUF397 domain-containing protein n=1 Tax=Streptomyces sp. NPDC002018 TaxID=3364629 RepID=UPI0036B67B31